MKKFLLFTAGFAGVLLFSGALWFLSAIYPLPDIRSLGEVNPDTSAMMRYRIEEAREEQRPFVLHRQWTPIRQIPRLFQRTIILAEDAGFWVHDGVDWHEVADAWNGYWEKGKRLRGASTISQQTAKNLFLTPERTLRRKIKELLITRSLEKELSKQRILELYLNVIEFGEGVFGIGSACKIYFHKTPAQLRLPEMIRLAAIIPNPRRLNPNRPSRELRWRCEAILQRLYQYQKISSGQFQEARSELTSFFEQGSLPGKRVLAGQVEPEIEKPKVQE